MRCDARPPAVNNTIRNFPFGRIADLAVLPRLRPTSPHSGHRALILAFSVPDTGVEQLMPAGTGTTRTQFSPTESAQRPRSAYLALWPPPNP
jgi:hypothetical protein